MATYFSPSGNAEVWDKKPDGYYEPDEWAVLHPTPEPTFEEALENKLSSLTASFANRVAGSFTTSQRFLMQFSPDDSLKMEGAIRLLSATGAAEGYLTQADDTTVYHVPLDVMKAVLVEMLAAYAQCHARKQELRALINSAETAEDLDEIIISWPV